MSFEALVAQLGEPLSVERFASDRASHQFATGDNDRYSVSCTVHNTDGLIYLVVMALDQLPQRGQ